jgi:hypothetical protein
MKLILEKLDKQITHKDTFIKSIIHSDVIVDVIGQRNVYEAIGIIGELDAFETIWEDLKLETEKVC